MDKKKKKNSGNWNTQKRNQQNKENNNAVWIIADRIKVIRILSEEERQQILVNMNYDEAAAFEPYKQAMKKRMKAV